MEMPVTAAVVGVGYWGPNLVRNLFDLRAAELTLVCDRDESALERVRRRYPSLRTTTSYDHVLEDETIEAIVIATPIPTHFDLAAAALRAGKHVLVEKPLAGSSMAAEALVALAAEHERVLMPGHTFLYSPPVLLIKDLISSGEIGEIFFVSTSRVNLGLHQREMSVIWDLGPHDFSILRFWLDESPAFVSALSRNCILPDVPDVAFVNLEYSSGTIAHVELSWLAPSKLRRTTIVGSKKMVVYDDTSNEPVRLFDSGVAPSTPNTFGEYQLTYRTGEIISPRVQAAEPLLLELEDFCAAVRHGSRPRSDARLGVDVVRVVEAADLSLQLSSTGVPVESARTAEALPIRALRHTAPNGSPTATPLDDPEGEFLEALLGEE